MTNEEIIDGLRTVEEWIYETTKVCMEDEPISENEHIKYFYNVLGEATAILSGVTKSDTTEIDVGVNDTRKSIQDNKIYFVHGINCNQTADEQSFIVGYYSSLELSEKAAEKFVEPEMECGVSFNWFKGKKRSESSVVKYLSDQDINGSGDEGIRIWIEAYDIDKELNADNELINRES